MGLTEQQLTKLGLLTVSALDYHKALPKEITPNEVVGMLKKQIKKMEGEK